MNWKEEAEAIGLSFLVTSVFAGFWALGFVTSRESFKPLLKYQPIEDTMQEMSKRQYDVETYNCMDFSRDGQAKLLEKGIKSSIIVGSNTNEKADHAFLGIWIDPQDGSYVTNWDYERTMK